MNEDQKGMYLGRRAFIKTSAMAVVGSTLAGKSVYAEETGIQPKPESHRGRNGKRNNKLLCLSGFPERDKEFIESIESNTELGFHVRMLQFNIREPQQLMESIQGENPGVLLICLPFFNFNYGRLAQYMGDLDIPIVLYSMNRDLIMIDANFAAELRAKGADVKLAGSEMEVIEMLKKAASPGILEGEKALIFGRPFESTSVPAHNLTEEYVYNQTGLSIRHRPMNDLVKLLKETDEANAREDMRRWKKEAKRIDKVSDKVLLDECRMYSLLRSIIEEEGLSAISIDCLSFTLMRSDLLLPLPCLAFARLRDEGITAACEADVCGMLSSMVFEKISGKPSYFANVSSVNKEKSSTVLRHCVAPLRFLGPEHPQLPYELHDYHGLGKGVVPKVEFPVGIEVTMGLFSKDLKDFVLWPGRTCEGVDDVDELFIMPDMPMSKPKIDGSESKRMNPPFPPRDPMDRFCANRAEVEVKDVGRFYQNIAGLHYIVAAGNYVKEIVDVLSTEDVHMIGPLDSDAS
ncbi:MAG: hypothetical protein JW896_12725 [Deltaproteobacteria bacterium]|nr:hypothetical protein [Deltaproteobacteria bacterium]